MEFLGGGGGGGGLIFLNCSSCSLVLPVEQDSISRVKEADMSIRVETPTIEAANTAIEHAWDMVAKTRVAIDAASVAVNAVYSEAVQLRANSKDPLDLSRLSGAHLRVMGGLESLAPLLRQYTYALIYAVPKTDE